MKRNIAEEKPSKIFDLYLDAIHKNGFTHQEKHIAEIGCGKNIGVGLMLLQDGAASATLFDPELQEIYPEGDPFVEILHKEFRERFGAEKASALLRVENRKIVFPATLTMKKSLFDKNSVYPESFDIILSASTLEHISDITGFFETCRMALKPQGRMLHFVDLRDHYFEHPYEMLKYSEFTWKHFLSPRGGAQLNRMKRCDYLVALEKTGFKLVAAENHFDIPENVFALQKTLFHSKFRVYPQEDLRASGLTIVAQKS